jgi:hypothetical protein
VYAAFHQRSSSESFFAGLFDELSNARIEIDVIELEGPAFSDQDSRAWCLALLYREMAHAIVFDAKGHAVEPSSVLRKRPMLVMRGSFSHPEHFEPGLFQAAKRQLLAEGSSFEREPATLFEMTIHPVNRVEAPAVPEMLESIQQLTPRGSVMASDYTENYMLSRYLRRYSTEPVRFILGVATAAKTLHEAFYQNLPGTLLEGLGRLLATNVKLYVVPMPRDAFDAALTGLPGNLTVKDSGSSLVTLDDLVPSVPLLHLLEYLRNSGRIVPLEPL